ncbi:hypothetical protein BS78_08G112400 [Paspalum vaginatum]|nr:hypothetical protein BS78_08G112400 [Paspalum vaginatum]
MSRTVVNPLGYRSLPSPLVTSSSDLSPEATHRAAPPPPPGLLLHRRRPQRGRAVARALGRNAEEDGERGGSDRGGQAVGVRLSSPPPRHHLATPTPRPPRRPRALAFHLHSPPAPTDPARQQEEEMPRP